MPEQCEFHCRHEQAQILSAIGFVLAPHRKYHGSAFPYIRICDDRVNQNSKRLYNHMYFPVLTQCQLNIK